jgi:FkbM family methyltransferase
MVYSQNDEQDYILNYFSGFKGTFLDIGANDGKNLSNTAALVDNGWEGVMVEPSPATFKQLMLNYLYNKRLQPVNCAVSDKAGAITFYECEDTLISSMNETLIKSWGRPYVPIIVQSLTYKLLLEELEYKQFDFISIDAEGMDLVILKQIDLTDVKMICVEHGNTFEREIKEYCEGFGMKQIMRNFENIVMAR